MSVANPNGTDLRFAMVPEWVLLLPLTTTALAVYCHLARYADAETHEAWPSGATLADRLEVSVDTVQRAIRQLAELEAVTVVKRRGTSNLYTVHRLPPGSRTGAGSGGGVAARVPGGSRTGAAGGSRTGAALTRPVTKPPNQTSIAPAARKRDAWWDALVALLGEPGPKQRALMGRLVKQAKQTPVEEIVVRAERYARAFAGKPLTLAAFEKHWSWLGSPAAQFSEQPERARRQAANRPKYTAPEGEK